MFRTFLLAASFCFLTSPSGAQETRFVDDTGIDAGDCTDPENPCATVEFAIDQAESGDIIDIAAGTYTESITLDKDLTLQGAGREITVIQAHEEPGQANERVMTLSGDQETEIAGVTIRYGRALGASGPEGFGGGLYNDGGVLTLSDVAFENNEADLNGGGLFNTNGSLSITSVVFTNNATHVTCTGCGGGGLYHSSNSIALNDVTFEENMTASSGGGIYADSDSITLDDIIFEGNTAAGTGGGILTALGSSLVLTNASFDTNIAGSVGGGLVVGGTSTLSHVTFHNNEAGGSGGGVFTLASSSSVLTDVTFTGNSAEISGGGMNARPLSTSDLTDVEFIGNSAGTGGGMTIEFDNSSSLTNVIFTNNVAGDGGGMFSFAGSSTLENVVFSGNEAEGRGGGFNQFGGDQVEFVNTTFIQNTAGNDGGGIWSSGDAVTLTNVTVSENVATVDGGGLFHIGGSSGVTILTNTIVWGNTAGEDGNEIYNFGGGTTELFYSLYSDEPGDIVEGGGFEAENSLTKNPNFVDAENGNLRLLEDSPAVEAGDPDTDLALFPTNDEGDPIDLDGELRIFGDAIDVGAYERHGTIDEETSPEAFAEVLGAPTPNPVRGLASLTLRVAETQNVVVEVFDALGRRVETLYDGSIGTRHAVSLQLDASVMPSGVYVIRATGENFVETRRVTIVR